MNWIDRFWVKVEKGEGCWEWQAAKNQWGYGQMKFGGTEIRAAAATGEEQRPIAARYGIAQTTVSQIVRRVTWTEAT